MDCKQLTVSKSHKLSFELPDNRLIQSSKVKNVKQGPKRLEIQLSIDAGNFVHEQTDDLRKLDMLHYLLRINDNSDNSIPSWTGFNTLLRTDIPTKSCIDYLPSLFVSLIDMSTISHVLKKSLSIARQLSLREMVVVMDQAMYAKTQ